MKTFKWVASLAMLAVALVAMGQLLIAQPLAVAQTTASVYTTTSCYPGPCPPPATSTPTMTVSTLTSTTTVMSTYVTTVTGVVWFRCATGQTCTYTAEYSTFTSTFTTTGPIVLVPLPEFPLTGIVLALTLGLLLVALSQRFSCKTGRIVTHISETITKLIESEA